MGPPTTGIINTFTCFRTPTDNPGGPAEGTALGEEASKTDGLLTVDEIGVRE